MRPPLRCPRLTLQPIKITDCTAARLVNLGHEAPVESLSFVNPIEGIT
jgi:hypothetical protein